MPRSLFLVSKQMNIEASQIFFSQNHFVIVPRRGFGNFGQSWDKTPNIMELELFLRHIGNSSIKNPRRMEVDIPNHKNHKNLFLENDSRGFQSWLRAIDLLKASAMVSAVTVTISHFDDPDEHLWKPYVADTQYRVDRKRILKRVVTPFSKLRGLKNYWVCEWNMEEYVDREMWRLDSGKRERKLEMLIMGKDYNSRITE